MGPARRDKTSPKKSKNHTKPLEDTATIEKLNSLTATIEDAYDRHRQPPQPPSTPNEVVSFVDLYNRYCHPHPWYYPPPAPVSGGSQTDVVTDSGDAPRRSFPRAVVILEIEYKAPPVLPPPDFDAGNPLEYDLII